MTAAPMIAAPLPQRPGRSPEKILKAAGWLSAEEAQSTALAIETLSRFHVVSRVTAPDGRTAIVKYPGETAAGNHRGLGRELFVYRLAKWKPGMARVLPKPIYVDEARAVLATAFAGPRLAHWPAQFAVAPMTSPNVAEALGTAMASWHADTVGIAMFPSLGAGILGLLDGVDEALAGRKSATSAFLRFAAADTTLSGILGEAKRLYRGHCLIHGDIRADNWALDPDGLKMIDWEMAGRGDPAWDAAGALAELALQGVRDGRGDAMTGNGLPITVTRHGPRFLKAYCAAGAEPGLAERLVPFMAARLLHVASEWVDAAEDIAGSADTEFAGAGIKPILSAVRALCERRRIAEEWLAQWT